MDDENETMRKAIKSLEAAGNAGAAQNLQDILDFGGGPESEPDPPDPEQDTGRCAQMAAAGAHAEAISCLERIIGAGGNDPLTHELMAASQEASGNLTKSATHLNRALELAGGRDDARYRILVSLAALWIRHGRPGKAVTIIEKKGSGVPRPDSRLSELHGRALMMQDLHEKAIAVFEAAVAAGRGDAGEEGKGQHPHTSLLAGLCKALYETGRHADAARHGAAAGAGSAEANLYAGMALERTGHKDGAAAHYGMAAAPAGVSGAHPEEDSRYGAEALYRTGRYGEAARRLGLVSDGAAAAPAADPGGGAQTRTPAAPGPEFCCLAGRILEGLDKTCEAQSMYRRAANIDKKNKSSVSLYHAALACRLLAASTGDDSWNNKAHDLARRALRCNGLYPDARDLSKEVAELLRPKKGPQTPRLGGRRGGSRLQEEAVSPTHPRRGGRSPDTAERGTAPKSDPGAGSRGKTTSYPAQKYTGEAAAALAEIADLIRDGRYSGALASLEKNKGAFLGGAYDHPARIKAQYFRGIIYCGQGRYDEAVTCFEKVNAVRDLPPPPQRQGEPSTLECLGHTVGEDPRHADACLMAGLAHHLRGKLGGSSDNKIDACSTANRMLEQAITLDPGLEGAKTLLALARRQLDLLRTLDAEKEEEGLAAGAFAEIVNLIRGGQYPEALDGLEKTEGVLPEDTRYNPARIKVQYLRGIIHCNLGEYGQAVTCLEQVDMAGEPPPRPGRPSTLECLGYTVGEDPRHADACLLTGLAHYETGLRGQFEAYSDNRIGIYRTANRMLEQAIALDPGLKGAKTLLGMTRMYAARLGMFGTEDEAMATLCEAAGEGPENAAALYHLAQILAPREERTMNVGAETLTPDGMYGRACKSPASTLEDTYAKGFALDLSHSHDRAVECYKRAIEMDPEYAGGLYGGADNARPIRPTSSPKPKPVSETHVLDTNACIPYIVMLALKTPAETKDPDYDDRWGELRPLGVKIDASRIKIPDKWKRWRRLLDGFEERVSAGRYVIPRTCRWEVRKNTEKIVSRDLGVAQDLAEIITRRAIDYLNDRLSPAGVPTAPEFGREDIMRVKRMYWRAWFGMAPKEKREYMRKKRFGGRHIRGGPPLGSGDVKILAAAARMAAECGDTRVVLFSDDHDFLSFRGEISTLSVDVRQV